MIALILLLLGPLAGFIGARWLRHRWPRLRWPLLALTLLALVVVAGAAAASAMYPGPEGKYALDAFARGVREGFVYPGAAVAVALPALVALTLSGFVPGSDTRTAVIACACGYLAVPAALVALLFTGCNYAGACF